MFLVEENINNEVTTGYWVYEKIRGKLINSYYVTLSPQAKCSCCYFAESKNPHNHFHIQLVKNWIKNGKPSAAMYEKTKCGKINTLCKGFIKK